MGLRLAWVVALPASGGFFRANVKRETLGELQGSAGGTDVGTLLVSIGAAVAVVVIVGFIAYVMIFGGRGGRKD
jgi:hypothetical protein